MHIDSYILAGLFNLRASDIAYNPFFISYAVVDLTSIRLYILDKDTKLTANASDAMTDVTLATHLNTNDNGVCDPITIDLCVEVFYCYRLYQFVGYISRRNIIDTVVVYFFLKKIEFNASSKYSK